MNKFKRGQLHSKLLLLQNPVFLVFSDHLGFYSRIEALNLELWGDNACVKSFAVEFHC